MITQAQAIETFKSILADATGQIASNYFHLPIDGSETPVYRERVYCYELYHQIRNLLPHDFPYSLGGEVDKQGHPIYRDTPVARLKPDLLLHAPGDRYENIIVIEVKPIKARREKIKNDLDTLVAFVSKANYNLGMLLVYGTGKPQMDSFLKKVNSIVNQIEIDDTTRQKIEIWWHPEPGSSARCVKQGV